MATQIELARLLESVGRNVNAQMRSRQFGVDPFTDVTGFHIYGELNLTLKLTAAEDTSEAQRLLKILQEYTLIAEACAAESSAALLEVQGERIHLLLPAANVDNDSVSELIRFSNAFTHAVYARISRTAGKDFQGFKMAADHGRAILVASGNQANGSIVSLGPAANAPAKELKKRGVAAHLRMRSAHFSCVTGQSRSTEWVDVPVREPSAEIARIVSKVLTERIDTRSAQYFQDASNMPVNVQFGNAAFLESFAGGYVRQAIKVQGFPLRADLDGFSKDVQEAFKKGNAGVIALVQRFFSIMRYTEQFRAQIGKTIDLPWAGDCATVIVLPTGAAYGEAREYLPAKAAAVWHSQKGGVDSDKRSWADHFGAAKWAGGVAGGDDQEGAGGYVLVAPIAGRNRNFMVGAGWGIGRSLDAQECDGVAGDDTVMPAVDYKSLDSTHGASFRELNSVFWISHGLTTDKLKKGGFGKLAAASPVYVPKIVQPVPQPRPWSESV